MKGALALAATLISVAAPAGSACAVTLPPTFPGHQYANQAHIGLSQARAIALRARSGSVMDQELEKEQGGSGFRYTFDIRSDGTLYEVGVDAKTGRVLENGHESAAVEAAEH